MTAIYDKLCHFLEDPETGWSIGTFGALAEFNRRTEEPASIVQYNDSAIITTKLGALRVNHHPMIKTIPYEVVSKLKTGWSQGVVLCLPTETAGLSFGSCLSDLGNDTDDLTGSGNGRLFDLGFGVPHIDFCIRTKDAALIKLLEKNIGCNVLDPENSVLSGIREASPTRVFRSALGRIEVYQAIPSSTSDSVTPDGPHTHLLPELLNREQTHSANIPVPAGWVPCLAFYPPNPIRSGEGNLKSFDKDAFWQFQELIRQYCEPEIADIKANVFDAIKTNELPDAGVQPTNRSERSAVRVALRQCRHIHGPGNILDQWQEIYEPTGRQ
jgi:hypothetical protein